VNRLNKLNDLSAREWMSESVSVWTQRGLGAGHADAQIEREHPAPFSFTDVARLVRLFTKRGMTVLDPFAGVGSTLKAMNVLYQRQKRVFPYGYPAAYVPNVHHQNVVVLRNERSA
jgi:DNA modification methylase